MRYDQLTYDEVIARDLQVMDTAAFALARDSDLPLRIFDMSQPGELLKILRGENIGTLVQGRATRRPSFNRRRRNRVVARRAMPRSPRCRDQRIATAPATDHGIASGTRAFAAVTLINLAYTVLEAGYGFATNSLALLSDALHNLGDVLGLALGLGRGGDRQARADRPPHLRLAPRDAAVAAGQCAAAGRVRRRAELGSACAASARRPRSRRCR